MKASIELLNQTVKTAKTLEECAELLAEYHHGIEYVSACDRELAYLNMGDTYDMTIAQEEGCKLEVLCWGDWLDEVERQHFDDDGEIRCCYCGRMTEWNEDGETRCIHCGRNTSTGEVMDDTRKSNFDNEE